MKRLLGICLIVAAGDLSAQSILEPLVFDLVLALGAEQGQVEVNSIFFVPYEGGTLSWTPVVEGAPADNLGLELGLWTFGVETNSAETIRRTESFGLIPQVHHDFSDPFGVLGGFRWIAEEELKHELIFRVF